MGLKLSKAPEATKVKWQYFLICNIMTANNIMVYNTQQYLWIQYKSMVA